MCYYIILIIYNLAHLKVRERMMLFGCSMSSTATTQRLSNLIKVTLYLIAMAITTHVHGLASLQDNPPCKIEFMLFGRVKMDKIRINICITVYSL